MEILKKHSKVLVFIISLIFTLYSLWYFTSTKSTIYLSNITFIVFVSLNLMLTIGILLYSQYISISLVNKAANDWAEQKCKYCCSNSAKLVCSSCDSIQWSSKGMAFYQSIAIFLAHHRWKVINTTLTFLFIGPLFFGFKFHFDEMKDIRHSKDIINKEIRNIIGYSNKFRPKLYNLELKVLNASLEADEIAEEVTFFLDSYYEYAWELAEVVDFLKHANFKGNNHLARIEAVNLIRKKNLIPKMDAIFFEAIDLLNKYSADSVKYRIELLAAIKSFNGITKCISCAIGEISFNPRINHGEIEIIEGCYKEIKKVNDNL